MITTEQSNGVDINSANTLPTWLICQALHRTELAMEQERVIIANNRSKETEAQWHRWHQANNNLSDLYYDRRKIIKKLKRRASQITKLLA